MNVSAEWMPARRSAPAPAGSLALVIRGQAYRGLERETFKIESSTLEMRRQAQARCAESVVRHIVEAYEASGHSVDVFLTVYANLGGPLAELLAPFGARLVSVNTVHTERPASQLLTLASAVRDVMRWSAARGTVHDALIVTRFDVYLKASVAALMGPARGITSFRLLWREAGGHWRHHSSADAVRRTFSIGGGHWWMANTRAPDALIALPGAFASTLLMSTRHELFPVRDMPTPLGFMHHMVTGLKRACVPEYPLGPPHRFMVAGQFDSNPCRASCMLNPMYDILPRMSWVTESGICQKADDFSYDGTSRSLCCPSPNYCCPNSIESCDDPGAVRFDVFDAGVSDDAILHKWPRKQYPPNRWVLTERSYQHVVELLRNASAEGRPGGRHWRLVANVPPKALLTSAAEVQLHHHEWLIRREALRADKAAAAEAGGAPRRQQRQQQQQRPEREPESSARGRGRGRGGRGGARGRGGGGGGGGFHQAPVRSGT